jgi:hypothetical protein
MQQIAKISNLNTEQRKLLQQNISSTVGLAKIVLNKLEKEVGKSDFLPSLAEKLDVNGISNPFDFYQKGIGQGVPRNQLPWHEGGRRKSIRKFTSSGGGKGKTKTKKSKKKKFNRMKGGTYNPNQMAMNILMVCGMLACGLGVTEVIPNTLAVSGIVVAIGGYLVSGAKKATHLKH